MEGFNSHLNMEQMNKALISLNDMYVKAATGGCPAVNGESSSILHCMPAATFLSSLISLYYAIVDLCSSYVILIFISSVEAEFRSYHLLSLMARHGKFKGDQQAFLSTLQGLRPEVRGSPLIQWVLRLRDAFASGNFVRFFLLVREAPYLPACLAHIYFPFVRARALQTLSEILSPSASARPPLVEYSWLRQALMLDSDEEAAALSAQHGFQTATTMEGPAVLMAKGAYVDPPPPVPRRPSALVSSKAPGARSISVTLPATRPLTPEEALILREQARQAEALRAETAAKARTAAEAEVTRRHQAEVEAATQRERLRLQAESQQRKVEEERRLLEIARLQEQNKLREEAARAAEAAAKAEAQRLLEEAAKRERQAAAARAAEEAALRAAAEAEARRVAEQRIRREAEQAEQRRREEELRRFEEERRRVEEEKRQRSVQRKFFDRWVTEMRRRVAEQERRDRVAASLKACRVGVVVSSADKV